MKIDKRQWNGVNISKRNENIDVQQARGRLSAPCSRINCNSKQEQGDKLATLELVHLWTTPERRRSAQWTMLFCDTGWTLCCKILAKWYPTQMVTKNERRVTYQSRCSIFDVNYCTDGWTGGRVDVLTQRNALANSPDWNRLENFYWISKMDDFSFS